MRVHLRALPQAVFRLVGGGVGPLQVRIAAIVSFLLTGDWIWLYWHQVVTGWTALALLYAALVFSRGLRWRHWYLALVLFPAVWSYVAIYRLDHFLWAVGPAVLFLSLATLWTGWVFLRYRQSVRSSGATLLASAFLLWGLHHLDYPVLRARGAWNPWGYYIDILLTLAVGTGILLLVLDDLRRGLGAFSDLSGDLQQAGRQQDVLDALLARPLTLPAVRGSALFLAEDGRPSFARGAGVYGGAEAAPDSRATDVITRASARVFRRSPTRGGPRDRRLSVRRRTPVVPQPGAHRGARARGRRPRPVHRARRPVPGRAGPAGRRRVGEQDLYRRLEARTLELARLSARMIDQHEDERRRLSRELHDETGQVFSAVRIELGVLREGLAAGTERPPGPDARADRQGDPQHPERHQRPPAIPAGRPRPPARAPIAGRGIRRTERHARRAGRARHPSPLSEEAELALFRALQEALSNVLRHAQARSVDIGISVSGEGVLLEVRDDGRGPNCARPEELERGATWDLRGCGSGSARSGARVRFGGQPGAGALLEVRLPAEAGARD